MLSFTMNKKHNSIILFDGICNLCNATVTFIIKRDKKKELLFAALQSESGQLLLTKHQLPRKSLDTFVLIQNDISYTKSTAALRTFKALGGLWSLAYVFIIIPRPIRDYFYHIIAQNRYQWFGKRDSCMSPSKDLKTRFL